MSLKVICYMSITTDCLNIDISFEDTLPLFNVYGK